MVKKVRNLIARASQRRSSSGPMKVKKFISRKKEKEKLQENYLKIRDSYE